MSVTKCSPQCGLASRKSTPQRSLCQVASLTRALPLAMQIGEVQWQQPCPTTGMFLCTDPLISRHPSL